MNLSSATFVHAWTDSLELYPMNLFYFAWLFAWQFIRVFRQSLEMATVVHNPTIINLSAHGLPKLCRPGASESSSVKHE